MTSVDHAMTRNNQPKRVSRMSRGPARNWTKMLLGNCRRRPARIAARRAVRPSARRSRGSGVQHLMEPLCLVGQHDQMHERIGVDDKEQDRRQEEEREQRQFDVEERELDRILEKEIGMRHRARGDREIEENEKVGEPQAAADGRRVVDRLLDSLQIVGLLGDLRRRSRLEDGGAGGSAPGG